MTKVRKSVGIFTTDRALVVQTWDPWIAEATGVPETAACGEPLARLYPDLAERGLLARLRRVAEGSGVDVLAPALHKFLLPCAPRDRTSRFEHMRQHVTLAPLRNYDGTAGVIVTIEDVTARFDRERRLAADLDSPDESVRLRAATTLAADGDAPGLLSNALTDRSWRVRRAAADGMASGGGSEVVDTLVEALRDHHRNPSLLNAAVTALAQTRGDVVNVIIPLLEHEETDVRMYAALALGLMDDARAVPPLLARLEDADTNVRFHAIEALGRIGDRAAADAITAIAETREFFVAFAALDALAAIAEPSVASRLLPLLEDPMLLASTAICLGAIGTEDVAIPMAALLVKADVPAAPIALALSQISERIEATVGEGALVGDLAKSAMILESARVLIAAIPAATADELRGIVIVLSWLPFGIVDEELAALLHNESVRHTVTDALSQRGVAAAVHIERAAASENTDVRRAAATALGRIGSVTSVPVLIEVLSDESFENSNGSVVIAAASALGAIGDGRAFQPLLDLLDHSESTVRQAAVAALNSIGHPRMEFAISARLSDESPRVRESAARIAGYFGYGSCLRQMVELCDDADPLVRRSVVEALANYDQRPAWSKIYETVSSDADGSVRAAGIRALGQARGSESIPLLVAAFQDPNIWVRYYAARASARRGFPHADILTALVESATRDHATPVRVAALEALGSLGASIMTEVIIGITREADLDVSSAALTALGQFSASQTASTLTRALNEGPEALQVAALDALAAQGLGAAHAVDTITSLVRQTRDHDMRRRAVRTLAEIGDVTAIRSLLSLAQHHRFYELVTAALASLPDARLRLLEQELVSRESVRELIAEAASRTRHATAARILAKLLDDPSPRVRLAAARGLGRLDLRDARMQLAALARTDENLAVRAAAQDALARG